MFETNPLIKQFARSLEGKGKGLSTIESYCRDARSFLHFVQEQGYLLDQLESQSLALFQRYSSEVSGNRNNSIRRTMIGVRQFFRFMSSEKLILDSPFDIVAIPQRIEEIPSIERIEACLNFCNMFGRIPADSLVLSRDQAIICLLGTEGLKTTEVLELTWSCYFPQKSNPELFIEGARQRSIELSEASSEAINRLRSMHKSQGRGQHGEHIILSFRGPEQKHQHPQMSRHGLKFVVYERGKENGFDHLNAELLRHVAIYRKIQEGWPATTITRHLGLKQLGIVEKHLRRLAAQAPGTVQL